MLRWISVLVVLALASPATADGAPPRPSAPPRFVLVRPGAIFHSAIPPEGQRAYRAEALPGRDAPALATRFRLVRRLGRWAEIESIAQTEDEAHCQLPSILFPKLALRFFVHDGDLVPVTVRATTVPMNRGQLELRPGVPLARDGARWLAELDGWQLPVSLEARDVGSDYVPPGPIRQTSQALRPETPIDLGDTVVTLKSFRTATSADSQAGRDESGAPFVQWSAATTASGSILVDVETGCAKYRGGVPESALRDAAARFDWTWEERFDWTWDGGIPARFSARPGARVWWPDGTPAGVAVGSVNLGPEGAPVQERRCFAHVLSAGPEGDLLICVAAGDVVESTEFVSDEDAARIRPDTRGLVALAIEAKTARPRAELERMVRAAARRRLLVPGVALAAAGEPERLSRATATKHGLQRYVVRLTIEEEKTGTMSRRSVDSALIRLEEAGQEVVEDRVSNQQITVGHEGDLESVLDGAMRSMSRKLKRE